MASGCRPGWRLLAGRAVGLLLGHGDRTRSRDAPDLSGAIRERPGLREAGQPRSTPRRNPTPAPATPFRIEKLENWASRQAKPRPSGHADIRGPGPREARSEPHAGNLTLDASARSTR